MPDATGLHAKRASRAGAMGGNGEGSTIQAVERGRIRLGKAIAAHSTGVFDNAVKFTGPRPEPTSLDIVLRTGYPSGRFPYHAFSADWIAVRRMLSTRTEPR